MSPGGGVGFEGAKWHGRSLSYVPFGPAFSLRSNRQPPVARAPCENKEPPAEELYPDEHNRFQRPLLARPEIPALRALPCPAM